MIDEISRVLRPEGCWVSVTFAGTRQALLSHKFASVRRIPFASNVNQFLLPDSCFENFVFVCSQPRQLADPHTVVQMGGE